MEKKFEKLFKKEDVAGLLDQFDKVLLAKKPKENDVNVAIQAIQEFLKLIKDNNWLLPKELIITIGSAMNQKLAWHQRQQLIVALGEMIDAFPNELVTNLEYADEIIAILKDRTENDEDPDNQFNAVIGLGKIGLLLPDKVLDYLKKNGLKSLNKNIRINSILALKEIAKKFDKTHVKQIIPFFTEIIQNDTEYPVIIQLTTRAIQEINETMYEDDVVFTNVLATEQVLCPYCNEFYPKNSEVCTNCGKPSPKCLICGKRIDLNDGSSYQECEHCHSFFHVECIKEWKEKSPFCPHCMKKLT
ncbi:MAG: RING finger domain-containing protein [Candidatus Helarchaeota archaeon]